MSGASADVLKEFLVAVGWTINQEKERTFRRDLEKTTAFVTLQAGLIAAALTKAAESLEKFYFMSQRTGSSVANLKAIGYAASQVGIGADAMRGSVEKLASFLRSSPGASGFLSSLGIQTTGANGRLKDTSELINDIGARISKMPTYMAQRYGAIFGLDENTTLAFTQHFAELQQYQAEYSRMVKEAGLNLDQASSGAHDFMVQVRGLGMSLSVLGDLITSQLSHRASQDVQHIRALIEDNFGRIAHTITVISGAFITFLDALISVGVEASNGVGILIDWWDKLDQSTKNLVKQFGLLLIAWRVLNAGFITSPIGILLTLVGVLALLWQDYQVWKKGGDSLIDWKKWEPEIKDAYTGVKNFVVEIDGLVKKYFGPDGWQKALGLFADYLAFVWFARVGKTLLGFLNILSLIPGSGVSGAAFKGLLTALGSAGLGAYLGMTVGSNSIDADENGKLAAERAGGSDDAAQESWKFWKSLGFSDSGAAAMLGQEEGESSFKKDAVNPDGSTRGAFQWSNDRREAIKKATGIDVWDSKTSHTDMLRALWWEMNGGDALSTDARPRIMNADDLSSAVSLGVTNIERSKNQVSDIRKRMTFAYDYLSAYGGKDGVPAYEAPDLSGFHALQRSMKSPLSTVKPGRGITVDPSVNTTSGASINQNNTFIVNGTSDPQATAMRIQTPLRSANNDLIRNAGGNSR